MLPLDRTSFGERHIVVADVQGEHRLLVRDLVPGRPLAAVIPLDRDFHTRLASLLRFHRRLFGEPSGRPPRSWLLSAYRRKRLQQMLRALDLRLADRSYREIAIALGDAEAERLSASEWKGSRSRSRIIRLVRAATDMMNGGYRKLLRIR